MGDYNEFYYVSIDPIQQKIDELKSLMKAELDEETIHQLEYDKKVIEVRDNEIKNLKNKIAELSTEIDKDKAEAADIEIISQIAEFAKTKITVENIERFLELILEPTYVCGYCNNIFSTCMVTYYPHKDFVKKVFEFFKLPIKEGNFRLPVDYTQSELEQFLTRSHYSCNTNSRYYEDNIDYCENWLYKPVSEYLSAGTWLTMPWQFLLRNPLILNNLDLIMSIPRYDSKFKYFGRIDKFQELTESQIRYILSKLTFEDIKDKNSEWHAFVKRNVTYCDNQEFIECVAESIGDYAITYNQAFKYFPEDVAEKMLMQLNISALTNALTQPNASDEDKALIYKVLGKKLEAQRERNKNGQKTQDNS